MLVLGVLAIAPAAQAAKVQTLGGAQSPPSGVTDAAGVLHVAWETVPAADEPSTVTYCNVARAGARCRRIGGFPSLVLDVFLLQSSRDGSLWLIVNGLSASSDNVTFALHSVDGGANWSAPATVGAGLSDINAAVMTPDGLAADTIREGMDAMEWQRVPLTGGTETRRIALGANSNIGDGANLLFLGGQPMVFGHGISASRFRILKPGADPYVDGSWTRWSAYPRLPAISADAASGPRGILALTHGSIPSGQKLRIWRLAHRHWRPLRRHNIVGTQLVNPTGRDLVEDARGTTTVAWADACHHRYCFHVRRASRHHFFGRTRLLRLSKAAGMPTHPSIAVNARGRGWLVWWGDATGTQIRVARLP